MLPGFDSRTRRHMWVEFVVGSRPCSEVFSPGSPVFLSPQKPTLPNSNSIGNSRATGLSVVRLLPSLNIVDFIYFFYVIFDKHFNYMPRRTTDISIASFSKSFFLPPSSALIPVS